MTTLSMGAFPSSIMACATPIALESGIIVAIPTTGASPLHVALTEGTATVAPLIKLKKQHFDK
jgi:hypothetical protein